MKKIARKQLEILLQAQSESGRALRAKAARDITRWLAGAPLAVPESTQAKEEMRIVVERCVTLLAATEEAVPDSDAAELHRELLSAVPFVKEVRNAA